MIEQASQQATQERGERYDSLVRRVEALEAQVGEQVKQLLDLKRVLEGAPPESQQQCPHVNHA